jgi:hypothetical protein
MKRMKTPHQFQRVIAVLRQYMAGGTIHDDDGTHLHGGIPDDLI